MASQFAEQVELSVPVLVDTMDDHVNKAYRGEPDRLYIIDAAGKITYQGGRGPSGFRPSMDVAPFVLYKLMDAK